MKIRTLLFALGLAASVSAQTYMENFNYGNTAGALCGTGGVTANWTPHSGAGTNPVQYVTTGLSLTGYPASSNGIGGAVSLAHGSGTREDINTALFPVTSGSLYVSFLMNVSNSGGTTGDYMFHLNDLSGSSIGGNFRGRLFIKDGTNTGTFKLGLSKGSSATGAVFTTTDYNLNTTYQVVVKYQFNTTTTTDDSIYAWIFSSTPPTTEPAPMLVATDMTIADLSSIGALCLRQGSTGTAACILDGGRIAYTWTNGALPVKWGKFTATKNNNAVNLNWNTISETNNSHFVIEKSLDGKSFNSIGKVKGAGNSSKNIYYSFTDENINATAYYRLKQVDVDGNFEYSKVVTVKAEFTLNISPNPFSDIITIENPGAQTLKVDLLDISGKVVMSENANNQIQLNTSGLANGIYFISVSNGADKQVKRIIKN